tara:strand:+ start:11017 stop:12312 length:1296 start_codon:yes stop_codon:yes gene_type:complete
MAQIGFGLDTNKTAMESGYDQYAQTLGDVLGATAEETWARNPLSSTADLIGLKAAALNDNSPLIPKEDLNKEYGDLGLSFEEDEYQSVVDIMVQEKEAERQRQSIMARGPQGLGVGIAKFGVGLGVSMLDPINVASAFIPGGILKLGNKAKAMFAGKGAKVAPTTLETQMAKQVVEKGFTRARFKKGFAEGAIGAIAVEPLVLSAANELQADYGLVDSFLNVTFGSIMGGGLHVGAGKLKDYGVNKQFKAKQRQARKNLTEAIGPEEAAKYRDTEVNLYKEYYPDDAPVMKALAETDPQTRKALLEKSLNDLLLEKQVDVSPIVDADPNLKAVSDTSAKPTNRVQPESVRNEQNLSTATNNTVNKTDADFDTDIENLTARLEEKREAQSDLRFDQDRKDIKLATEELDEATVKTDEFDAAVKDAINCMNGR